MAEKGIPIASPFGNQTEVFILPLRPETDADKTAYPALTFLVEQELEGEVLCKLVTPINMYDEFDVFDVPCFSIIPAIKFVREKTDWSLKQAKDYVEKIGKNNAGQIHKVQADCIRRWANRPVTSRQL